MKNNTQIASKITTLTLNRIHDIKTVEEYEAVVRKSRQETLVGHPDVLGPIFSMKDCFSHEDPVYDPPDPTLDNPEEQAVVVYAELDANAIRESPRVSLIIETSPKLIGTGIPAKIRACDIIFHSTGCYVSMIQIKYSHILDVWIDGHPAVSDKMNHAMPGSIISPEGRLGRTYQVLLNSKNICETRDATRVPFADEIKCPVCMDVIVKTVSSNVCNHKFCCDCINQIKKITIKQHIRCPCCRRHATEWFHDTIMDNLIWLGALAGNLDANEARTYVLRREDCGMGGCSEEQIESICCGRASK